MAFHLTSMPIMALIVCTGAETLGLRAFDVLEHSRSYVVLFQGMPDGHGISGGVDVWVTYRLQGRG